VLNCRAVSRCRRLLLTGPWSEQDARLQKYLVLLSPQSNHVCTGHAYKVTSNAKRKGQIKFSKCLSECGY